MQYDSHIFKNNNENNNNESNSDQFIDNLIDLLYENHDTYYKIINSLNNYCNKLNSTQLVLIVEFITDNIGNLIQTDLCYTNIYELIICNISNDGVNKLLLGIIMSDIYSPIDKSIKLRDQYMISCVITLALLTRISGNSVIEYLLKESITDKNNYVSLYKICVGRLRNIISLILLISIPEAFQTYF